MKRVFGSAAAVVFGIMLLSGIGNSVASASENVQYRNPYAGRETKSSKVQVTKYKSPYAGRESRTLEIKVTNYRNSFTWRLKRSNKAIVGHDGLAGATGR